MFINIYIYIYIYIYMYICNIINIHAERLYSHKVKAGFVILRTVLK